MLVFFTISSLMECQNGYLALFRLFSIINSSDWFWMGCLWKNIQLMLEFLKVPFLVLQFSYINDFSDVICNIAIYTDYTTFYSKCNQTSDQWKKLDLASEIEPDLRDTVHSDRKELADFNAVKTQLVSFGQCDNCGAIDVKMDGSALTEKSPVKMLQLSFSFKMGRGIKIR